MAQAAIEIAQRLEKFVDGDGAFSPSGARSDGQDAIADASEAHEANIARFWPRLRPEWKTTSRGRSNLVPG
jgi:hypothetical protein